MKAPVKFYLILTFVVSMFTVVPWNVWAMEIQNIAPPALVRCQTEASCDLDSKHLEMFISSFYEWYVVTANTMAAAPKKLYGKHYEMREAYLSRSLSPEFQAWRHNILNHPGKDAGGGKYRCAAGSDPLLCAQDWPDKWMYDVPCELIAADDYSALALVRMSVPAGYLGKSRWPYMLAVRMKPVDGAWRIDGVMALNAEADNDK